MADVLAAMADWEVPNAAGLVLRPGKICEQVGDIDRPYALASITKLFTAYATLLATEEGVLTLDTQAGPPGSTVRHLLAHTAGYGFASDAKVLAEPAKRRIYSNRGMEVLSVAVETATGIPFADYVREGVFEPLGMTASSLDGSAAFAMKSTARDLQRFVEELFQPRLLATETAAMAKSVQFPGLNGAVPGFGMQRPCDWGLGFELKGTKSPHWTGTLVSIRTYGHFGGSGTFLWVDPDRQLACIALTDRRFDAWAPPLWSALSDGVVKTYSQ
jgi:CubicO group peptidase (beta-lactamase class C family)